ncbi:Uncharacterised protein [Enterobacter hormaechei]|nr:Uncharacterised protein [Enterobacter hormaechei]CZZ71828.1 Uncharacterised protein [Enterobacter hormaechei]
MPARFLVDFGTQAERAGGRPCNIGLIRRGVPRQKIRVNDHQLTLAEILTVGDSFGNGLAAPRADIAKRAQALTGRRERGRHFQRIQPRHAENARLDAGDGFGGQQRFQSGVLAVFVGRADDVGNGFFLRRFRVVRVFNTFGNAHNHNDRLALVGNGLQGF